MANDNLKTGTPQTLNVKCRTGDACLVTHAYELKRSYNETLANYNALQKKYNERLQMAEFVREVAMAAAQSKDIKAADVWNNMRTNSQGGAATSYDNTWLKKDIAEMINALENGRNKIDSKAKILLDFISTETFQQHLVKFHSKALDPQTVEKCYHCTPIDDEKSTTPIFRELDHILAILTNDLYQCKGGLEFLENITDENWLQKKFAFADMWSYIKKIKSASEPIGKVINNFAPVLTIKINQLIQTGKVATIKDILRDPDLKKHFDFLDKKYGVKISEWLEHKALQYGESADDAAKSLRYRNDWNKTIKSWSDKNHEKYDPDFKLKDDKNKYSQKLDGLWLGLTLDSVALIISVVNLYSNLKKAKWNDFADAANSLLSVTKTIVGGAEDKVGMQITALNDEDKFLAQAKMLKTVGRYMGLIGGIVGAVLSLIKAYDGFKSKDWDVVLVNLVGSTLSLVGGFAAFCGATAVLGVTAVLGLLLAIITSLVLDPPIIDYIEDVAWGEDAVIPITDTITTYYKKLFKLDVSLQVPDYDANYSFIRIESQILSNTLPVFVEIADSHNKSLGKVSVYPGLKKVEGKGAVEKELGGWDYPWPTHGKRIKIMNPWEIWKDIKRDNTSKYTIRVGIDPSNDLKMSIDKMALNDDTTVAFPNSQSPILVNVAPDGYDTFVPRLNVQNVGGSWKRYIKITNNIIRKFVYTKYADNCSIKIIVEKYGIINKDLYTNSISVSTNGPDSIGLTKTQATIPLPAPEQGGEYRVILTTELWDSGGKKRGSDETYLDIT
jgi:hypothetical protein